MSHVIITLGASDDPNDPGATAWHLYVSHFGTKQREMWSHDGSVLSSDEDEVTTLDVLRAAYEAVSLGLGLDQELSDPLF